jgi:hypothetical protein
MLAVFVGVGGYTFYPPPQQFDNQIRDLERREQALRNSKSENELSTAEREQIQQLVNQRNDLIDAEEEAHKPWTRNTSVMLIVLATLAMAVSLVRTDQLPVISNGLLLGGVFTMLYGVGWIVATDTSIIRFLVITVAFVITLGLGYVRFVRRSRTSPAAVESVVPEGESLAAIERRLRDLEERMSEAADALARKGDRSSPS